MGNGTDRSYQSIGPLGPSLCLTGSIIDKECSTFDVLNNIHMWVSIGIYWIGPESTDLATRRN